MKIRLERHYPHPIDAVWAALTERQAIERWWIETDFEPVLGQAFYFQDTPQGSWDGRVTGEVLEVDEPRRIRFSWRSDGHETEVTYALEPVSGGTRLVLEHVGFHGLRGLFLRTLLRFGWGGFVKKTLPEMSAHFAVHGRAQTLPMPSKRELAASKIRRTSP